MKLCLLGRFALLGPAAQGGELASDKPNVLLALLALRGAAWEREALALMLWPDSETPQARANLRRALFDLREMLAHRLPAAALEEMFVADKRSIELRDHPALLIDTRLFSQTQLDASADDALQCLEALQCARHLYQGPLLPQLRLDQSPAIAQWLQARREALQRQALRALGHLAALHEQQAQIDAAVDVLQQWLRLEPLDEEALQRSLRLLGSRRRDEALQLFHAFSQRLETELGVRPQAATMALIARLHVPTASPAAPGVLQRRRVVALVIEWQTCHDGALSAETLGRDLDEAMSTASHSLRTAGAWVLRAEDGELLAFFGHPEAQEHALRQALNLCLELLARPGPLPIRAGLHLGWVHVRADAANPDTLGALSREARRLCWQSAPGSARVSASLRRLALRHHRFSDADDTGAATLLAAVPLQQRWAQQGRRSMVGREQEIAELYAAWQRAQGQRVAVWLQGEPGLGKTRLMQALRAHVRQQARPPRLSLLHCLPETSQSPLHPVLCVLRQGLREDAAGEIEAALQRLALRLQLPADALAPLAPLFDPERDAGGGRMPRSAELFSSLIRLLEAYGQGRPQLLMIEDLHWADPSTLELLTCYLQRPKSAHEAVLLVLSSREAPPLTLAPCLQTLELQALPEAAMRALAEQLQLPQHEALLASAQGVPLFAQELASAWQQHAGEPVPATLWDLLAARLDRLHPGLRRLAQVVAVLGSDCDEAMLRATLGEEAQARLSVDLQRLRTEGLLQDRADERWGFRHALQREAAYQSLGSADRRQLHRCAAKALLGPLAARGVDDPASLAHHLTQCLDPSATFYWLQAGRRAAAQSAHVEACHALSQGLALLDRADASGAQQQALRPALLQQLGFSRLALEGYGSARARAHFEQAWACVEASDSTLRFQILWGLWLGARGGPEAPPALSLARSLLELAQHGRDAAALVQARAALGNALMYSGELRQAVETLTQAATEAESLPARELALRFGEHGGITARAACSWPLAWLGEREAALTAIRMALSQARELGHAHTLAYALASAAMLHRHWQEPQAVQPLAEELARFAERHGMRVWGAAAQALGGWSRVWQGDALGLGAIAAGAAIAAVALPSKEASFLSILCEAQLQLGQADQALDTIKRALQKAEEHQEHYLGPELWRMKADALKRLLRPTSEVQQARQHALRLAAQMQARLWLERQGAGR